MFLLVILNCVKLYDGMPHMFVYVEGAETGLSQPLAAGRFGNDCLFFITPATNEATLVAMRDAFLQVSVFVATTLALVYWFEKQFSFDLGEVRPIIPAGSH